MGVRGTQSLVFCVVLCVISIGSRVISIGVVLCVISIGVVY